ncbi:MAG TPA: biopolymer transporter ExbD [Bdellovibrionota bacterium]|jgi:biopolymer transport protein ExbD|nr:biopolymer transporter ExbD [Bdellovibrionota bacterium]
MRRRRFQKRRQLKDEMVLQITSMADILVILLVFLLKSFSTGISNITPAADLMLPEVALSKDEVTEGVKLEISPGAILVDGKPAAQLSGFNFEVTDTESNGTSRSLNTMLISERDRIQMETKVEAGQPAPEAPKILVMADQKTPYRTIKSVMNSAANAGFGDFKLIVVEDK